MKKYSIRIIILLIFIYFLFLIPNVCAETYNITDSQDLKNKINEAVEGDVIVLQEKNYDIKDKIIIDKPLTIQGVGKGKSIIYGKIEINAPEVTLKSFTLQTKTDTSEALLTIFSKINLVISDVEVKYTNKTESDFGSLKALYMYTKTEQSNITISDSEFYGKYAIQMATKESNINITNSILKGQVAFSIQNPENIIDKENGENVININNCNITCSTGNKDNASIQGSAISINGQEALKLNVTNSNITNTGESKLVPAHLFSFGNEKLVNQNVEINIIGGSLNNTISENTDSKIIDFGKDITSDEYNKPDARPDNNNIIHISNDTSIKPEAIENKYSTYKDYAIIGIHDEEGNITVNSYKKNEPLTIDSLKKIEKEGFILKALYTDKDYKNEFNQDSNIIENVDLYAKFISTKIHTGNSVTNDKMGISTMSIGTVNSIQQDNTTLNEIEEDSDLKGSINIIIFISLGFIIILLIIVVAIVRKKKK